jgi:exonuclease SbcC
MLKRIELTNFMSHKHTVIDLAPGLTVLVGPNNCGKSAVVAALQILCSNENSTYVRRHGEDRCSIRVETDDGHVVEWHRKKTPYYVIDGKPFDRLKEGMPEQELNQLLRLPKVQAGNEDCDAHFGAQKSPIFLIDKTGSHAASFFASSSDAVRLVEMQGLHRTKATEANRRKKRLEDESRQLNAELESLGPAAELERRVDDLERRHGELGDLANTIRAATHAAEGLMRQEKSVRRHALDAEALKGLSTPPVLAPTQVLEDHRRGLLGAAQQETRAKATLQSLASLAKPPDLADVAPLVRLIDALIAANRAVQRRGNEQTVLEPLNEPPRFQETSDLIHAIDDLQTAGRLVTHHERTCTTVATVSAPPTPADAAPLHDLLERMTIAVDAADDLRRKAKQAEDDLADAANELRAFAEQAGVCPTCGAVLDADSLIAHAAVGPGEKRDE